jgi:YfiH family protein
VLELIAQGLSVYFSTRKGGVSSPPYDSLNLGLGTGDREASVRRNRRLLLEAAGVSARRLARAEQVHGSSIAIVSRGGIQRNVDGLITDKRGLTLVISTADCYPVIIYSPSERVLAALHVGRAGAAGGIIPRALDMLATEFRMHARNTIAVIGPGICRKCYAVWKRSASRFPAEYMHERNGKRYLDLRSFCIDSLVRGGLRKANIYHSGYCTSCEPEYFYSHRRDHAITGRHWTIAAMHDPR